MPQPGEDPSLDDMLRAVPLPDGLGERLRAAGGWSDEAIDKALGAVRVPAEILARCRSVPSDEELDESLRAVPLPFTLLARLRGIPPKRTTLARLGRMAIAASIFCACMATFWSLIAVSFSLSIVPSWPERVLPQPPDFAHQNVPPSPPVAPAELVVTPQEIIRPETPSGAEVVVDPRRNEPPSPEALAEKRRQENILLSRTLPLAAPYREPDLGGDLEMVAPLDRVGVTPPTLRGFDRKFLYKHNTQPIVNLAANPGLGTCAAPLTTSTASFELWRKRLAEKRLPDPGEVRVEEFLAAVAYPGEPPAPGAARVTALGGVTPWSEAGARLLQVSVQTGTRRPAQAQGTHVVVALDVSQSMGTFGRLDRATWALWRTIDKIAPRDRLSVTAFHNEAMPVAVSLGRGNATEYRAALSGVRTHGGTNVFVGLREALNLALERAYSGERTSRVVLITDDRPVITPAVETQVTEAIGRLAESGLPLSVIDLGNALDPSETLQRWASAGKGTYTLASSPQAVERALAAVIAGGEAPSISTGALRVRFNPQTVAAYRLLGQEVTAAGGLAPENVKANLPAGETATALFEVWFKPGAGDEVATAEFDYTTGETGSRKTVRQRISRLQFAPTWAESPLALQQAALVAETAEILRTSPFAPNKGRSLKPVLEAAQTVNTRLAEWPEWQRFLRLVEQSEAVRTRSTRP